MKEKRRKPTHPGRILDEHYIKPLHLNLEKLAEHLNIARNTLFKVRVGLADITPALAIALSEAFDTTPQFWMNLQQKFDLWKEETGKIKPILKNGKLLPSSFQEGLVKSAAA